MLGLPLPPCLVDLSMGTSVTSVSWKHTSYFLFTHPHLLPHNCYRQRCMQVQVPHKVTHCNKCHIVKLLSTHRGHKNPQTVSPLNHSSCHESDRRGEHCTSALSKFTGILLHSLHFPNKMLTQPQYQCINTLRMQIPLVCSSFVKNHSSLETEQ